MSILDDLKAAGVVLTDDQKEMYELDEMLSMEQEENAQNYGLILRLRKELEVVKEERDELKEKLCEFDPDFGDLSANSDRGYEMKYD